jgi:hypothetical protein
MVCPDNITRIMTVEDLMGGERRAHGIHERVTMILQP